MTQPTTPIVDRRRNRLNTLGPAARVSASTLKPKTQPKPPASTEHARKPGAKAPGGPPLPFAAQQRDKKVSELWPALEVDDAWCSVCGGLLYKTSGGPCCDNGHGDPGRVSWEHAAQMLYDAGKSAEETALRMAAELEDVEAFFKELDARPPTGALDEAVKTAIIAALDRGAPADEIMKHFPRVPLVVIDAIDQERGQAMNAKSKAEQEAKAARAAADDAALEKAFETMTRGRRTRKTPETSPKKPPRSETVEQAPKIDPRQMSFPDEPAGVPYVTDRLIKTKSGKEYTARLSVELNQWTGFVPDIPQHEGFGPLSSRDELLAKLTQMLEEHEERVRVRERRKTARDWLLGGMSPENVAKSILGTLMSREEIDAIAAELAQTAATVEEIRELADEDEACGRPEDAVTPEQVAERDAKRAEHRQKVSAKKVIAGVSDATSEVFAHVLMHSGLDPAKFGAAPPDPNRPVAVSVPPASFVTLEAHQELEGRVAKLEALVAAFVTTQIASERTREAKEQEDRAIGALLDLVRKFE